MRKFILWTLAGIALAAVSYTAVKHFGNRLHRTSGNGHQTADSEPLPRTVVELNPQKFSSANLQTITAARQPLQHWHTVPGKIDYNGLERVDLKSPLESTVQQVLVKPGDVVAAGARLAVLDSPDIGLARAEVEKHQAELRLAMHADDWAEQVAGNTRDLLDFLQKRPKPAEIEKRFENKPLGDQRQHLLASYARFVLAEETWRNTQPLIASGSLGAQVTRQRETNLEVAKAEFQAAREQTRFDQMQQREKARAEKEHAQRMLEVSRQRLKTMLGTASQVHEPTGAASDSQTLTRYFLITPIAGTVEQRTAAAGQRIPAGQTLFVVADTKTLWISADLREQDWPALRLSEGARLKIRVPALEGREISAEVSYVGRAVSTDSQSVPLVATVANPERLLKPGMFAWVILPIGSPESLLAVPSHAILTHDNRSFVFVEEGPRRYRRQDIVTGIDSGDWVAVTGGLQAGDKVVDRGTFLLKSELLLEPED